MRIDMQPAYVLHTRPYRDSSLLIDFLTRDYGVLRAVGRGMSGSNKRGKNRIMPFQPYLVTLSGKTDLLSLYQSEYAGRSILLKHEALFSAMYLNELLTRTLQFQESHSHVFIRYGHALSGLEAGLPIESVLRRFEWWLLEELGYGVDAGSIDPAESYHYEEGAGFVRVNQEAVTDLIFSGELLLALTSWVENENDAELPAPLARFSKVLMRRRLLPLLGDRPLLSRKLFSRKNLSSASAHSGGDLSQKPK